MTSVLAQGGFRLRKVEPRTPGCTAVSGSTGVHTQGAALRVPSRPSCPCPRPVREEVHGLSHPKAPADGPFAGRNQTKPSTSLGEAQPLAWSPAWARLGTGAQLPVSPPRPPPGLVHVGADSGGCTGAWGLAGWGPRECIHSNHLSEDRVPVGPRLLSAGA